MKFCLCGCGKKIIKEKNKFIRGHNYPLRNKEIQRKQKEKERTTRNLNMISPFWLCGCGCKEIVFGGKQFKNGHNTRVKNPMDNIKSRKKIQGQNHPLYGIGHTIESKNRISKNHANVSGKNNPMYGIHRFGNKNPNWNNGISFEPYCQKFTKELREEVREKYNYKCYICNKDQEDNLTKNKKIWSLSIHHIYYDKNEGCNGKNFSLVPLCLECHGKTNGNRDYWKQKLSIFNGEL